MGGLQAAPIVRVRLEVAVRGGLVAVGGDLVGIRLLLVALGQPLVRVRKGLIRIREVLIDLSRGAVVFRCGECRQFLVGGPPIAFHAERSVSCLLGCDEAAEVRRPESPADRAQPSVVALIALPQRPGTWANLL
jgi:hypothetical protein